MVRQQIQPTVPVPPKEAGPGFTHLSILFNTILKNNNEDLVYHSTSYRHKKYFFSVQKKTSPVSTRGY